MKILCTFSGKFGDILWSLPTVREIQKLNSSDYDDADTYSVNAEVDFGIMPQYESLLPLLNAQSYINKAFVIKDWICVGSPAGDQPWEAPFQEGYDKVYHLTYRNHPGKDQPLIGFIAAQQEIKLENPIPFLSANGIKRSNFYYVAYAFNDSMLPEKLKFLDKVREQLKDIYFIDISQSPWELAAIDLLDPACLAFIGCRSSNYVLACGVGQRVFVYEPNIARSRYGPWGTTFTCPYANETETINAELVAEEIKSKVVEVKQ